MLEGRRISVVGLAASGKAAAKLALERGGEVHVSDLRTDTATHASGAELRALGAKVDLGEHPMERIAAAQTVVVSPGIPPHAPVLRELSQRSIRWISEPEFAFGFFDGSLIAVTGTNGKTTTAVLVAHLLQEDGQEVALGGNIGRTFGPPASELALRGRSPHWYVVEMSSFQLAAIDCFRPDIGIVTNLAPDHLDWYESVESYYADKANLFLNAQDDSQWVLNGDDPAVEELAEGVPGRHFYFTEEPGGRAGSYVDRGVLTVEISGAPHPLIPAENLQLLGAHNVENALAASATAWLAGAAVESIQRGLASARSLPHRTEHVADIKGVRWINDSKATNVSAARSAISSFSGGDLVVLLGGKDKGEDFSPLEGPLVEAGAHVVAFGEAGPRILRTLGDNVAVELLADDFERIIGIASERAGPHSTVLFSPACSSFDMFDSYEQRGQKFKEIACALLTEETN